MQTSQPSFHSFLSISKIARSHYSPFKQISHKVALVFHLSTFCLRFFFSSFSLLKLFSSSHLVSFRYITLCSTLFVDRCVDSFFCIPYRHLHTMALPNIPSSSSGPRVPPSSTWEASAKGHPIPAYRSQPQHLYLSDSQPPVPPHPHSYTPLSSFSDPLFGLHPHTGSGHLGSTTALAADLPIVFHVGGQGSHPHSPSHSTPPSMGPSAFPSPMPRIEFAVPQGPGKARKRHKVATSCNRCRQNKVLLRSRRRLWLLFGARQNITHFFLGFLIRSGFHLTEFILQLVSLVLSANAIAKYPAPTANAITSTAATPMHSCHGPCGATPL